MATIGNFSKSSDGSFIGEIVTLSVQAKNVRIVPETTKLGEPVPSYRIMVGCAEIGAGRAETPEGGRSHIALKLDDPSFAEPIYAKLFEDAETKKFILFWSRQTEQDGG